MYFSSPLAYCRTVSQAVKDYGDALGVDTELTQQTEYCKARIDPKALTV